MKINQMRLALLCLALSIVSQSMAGGKYTYNFTTLSGRKYEDVTFFGYSQSGVIFQKGDTLKKIPESELTPKLIGMLREDEGADDGVFIEEFGDEKLIVYGSYNPDAVTQAVILNQVLGERQKKDPLAQSIYTLDFRLTDLHSGFRVWENSTDVIAVLDAGSQGEFLLPPRNAVTRNVTYTIRWLSPLLAPGSQIRVHFYRSNSALRELMHKLESEFFIELPDIKAKAKTANITGYDNTSIDVSGSLRLNKIKLFRDGSWLETPLSEQLGYAEFTVPKERLFVDMRGSSSPNTLFERWANEQKLQGCDPRGYNPITLSLVHVYLPVVSL